MLVVTGGAGFIGSCFLRKCNDEGVSDILVVDQLGTELKWKNLVGKKFIDICSPSLFLEKVKADAFGRDISAIVHLGACSTTTERDADYLLENNYHYSRVLGQYSLERDIRYIYASSAATYGMGENGYSDDYFALKPLNMYGYSKHLFDEWVLRNGLEKKFTGIKFFNVFGPNEYHKGEQASMIFKAYSQILDSGKVRLFRSNTPEYGDGDQMRDFVYIKDALDVMWKMLGDDSIAGIFNLGTGKARSWNDLMKAVFSAMGRKPVIEYVDMPASLKDQYQNFTEAEMAKLEKTSAKISFRSLEDSVSDYVQNYLMQNFSLM